MKAKKPVIESVEPPKKTSVFQAKVIQHARNPQWMYCVPFGDNDNKISVVVPKRFNGKLTGKVVYVEAITDASGVTYRYAEQQRQ